MAIACGERAVQMVWEDLRPSRFLTPDSVHNALVTYMAIGGSTNAAIHLIAIARRAGLTLTLEQIDAAGRKTPVLANLFPNGNALMQDFYDAGGLLALLNRLRDALRLDALTVNGRTLGENIANATCYDDEVIRPLARPVVHGEAVAVLRGNLAPEGAVLKVSAASEALLRHRGRAVVFESRADLARRIDDPALAVDASSVLVLKLAGPVASGMPEWGALPIPKKLLAQGVRDMVRVSDARMSGTHYGTCVLHVAPESAVGGPLALVRDGDEIELDVPARRLHLHVADSELAARRTAWRAPELPARGYARLYRQHVAQAPQGCDFDFLENGPAVPEPEIF